jgi:hypothetical protein
MADTARLSVARLVAEFGQALRQRRLKRSNAVGV